MKLRAECVPCLVERAKFECDMVFSEDRERIEALREFIRFLADNLSDIKPPSFYGTERERIIKRISGVYDPYRELKRKSNDIAKSLMRDVTEFYAKSQDKIEALLRIAAVANAMEYGVKGYEYSDEKFASDFKHLLLAERLHWEKDAVCDALSRHDAVIYLTDNAGEIVFDAFVVRELIRSGKFVIVSPKSAPVLNDATVEDAIDALKFFGIRCISPSQNFISQNTTFKSQHATSDSDAADTADTADAADADNRRREAERAFEREIERAFEAKFTKHGEKFTERSEIFLIPSGAYVGISLDEAPQTLVKLLRDERFLVIAKGMGNYEGISEFEEMFGGGRLLYILKAKCAPVAQSIGVKVGELVAKLV